MRADVVGKREQVLGIAVVVLHGNLDRGVLLAVLVLLGGREVDRLGVQHLLVLVEVLDERHDAALVAEHLFDRLRGPLVNGGDMDTGVQKRQFPQPCNHRIELKIDLVEDLGVRQKPDRRPGFLVGRHVAQHLHVGRLMSARELLRINLAVAAVSDLGAHLLRERVHAAHADAVQAARYLIASAAELAAGVQHGQGNGQGVFAGLFVQAHGDAAAVVAHGDGIIPVYDDLDVRAEARQRLVDRVVNDLGHQMVQSARIRRADIHTRAAPNGLKPFENLNLRSVVGLRLFHVRFHSFYFRFQIAGHSAAVTDRTASSSICSCRHALFQRFWSVAAAIGDS